MSWQNIYHYHNRWSKDGSYKNLSSLWMQENDTVWKEAEEKYNFNVIYFYRHDATPWAQAFMISRLKDSSWAPVYVDDYTIIFLKRNEKNQAIIDKYELPREIFAVN